MKRFLILQYDNRALNDNMLELTKINKSYCETHNYEYRFIDTSYDLPVYWIKVYLVNEILKTDKYDGVLWLDTDACIYNATIKLENLILENKSFYLSPDNKIWPAKFNAGVFMVLNTNTGKQMIEEWMKCYNEKDWTKDVNNNKFSTSGSWAGTVYEQGSFTNYILPKYNDEIKSFDGAYLQSFYSDTLVDVDAKVFTLHFAGGFKKEISSFLITRKLT